jgi:hypothetical protein
MKKQSRKGAVRKADQEMSLYIRARDKTCYCGKPATQNGHYYSRTHYSTRWDEENCLACCAGCNMLHEQNPEPMRRAMLSRGRDLEELEKKYNSVCKLSTDDILSIAEEYRKKRSELCNR